MNSLPITAVAAAKASLLDPDLVPTRKKIIADTRAQTIAWLKSEGYELHAVGEQLLHARCKASRQRSQTALARRICMLAASGPHGRQRAHYRGHTRRDDGFRKAFTEVMASSTAGLVAPRLPGRL